MDYSEKQFVEGKLDQLRKRLSVQRRAEIFAELSDPVYLEEAQRLRAEYTLTNGFSKDRLTRQFAVFPPLTYIALCEIYGNDFIKNKKKFKEVVRRESLLAPYILVDINTI